MTQSRASLTGVALAGAISSVLLTALVGIVRSGMSDHLRLPQLLVTYAAWLPSAVLAKALLAYAWARQQIERGQCTRLRRPARTAALMGVALAVASLLLSFAMAPLNAVYMRWVMEHSLLPPKGAWAMLPLVRTALVTVSSLVLSWWTLTAALQVAGEREQARVPADADVAAAACWWFAAAFLAFASTFLPSVSVSAVRVFGSSASALTVPLCLLPSAWLAYACARRQLRRPIPAMRPLRLAACAGSAALLSVAIFAVLPVLLLLLFVSFGNLLYGGAGVLAYLALGLLFLVPVFPSVLLALRLYRLGLPFRRPQSSGEWA